MFDPPAVPFEGGSILWSIDGGSQHSAGAQFAGHIAVPGAAAVPITGVPTIFQQLERAEVYHCVKLALNRPETPFG